MSSIQVLAFPRLDLALTESGSKGDRVLAGVLELAQSTIDRLRQESERRRRPRIAAVGRLRGTGRGIHFRDLIASLENSALVAGAAWDGRKILAGCASGALAKLRWSAGADDLPIHVHEHSDRFIIVHEGRGFFHVSDQDVDHFDGSDVRTIPARERDVFIFTRGVAHTFSTLTEPMTLLSCQLPYLPFDDPRQYRLPKCTWTARGNPEVAEPKVGCDPAWTVLAGMCGG
jgi:mannose-6-phosphate isomerase-like protein (cupin superfamily)